MSTVEERRSALVAWVSIVFGVDAFFRSALAELQPMISLQVYDGEDALPKISFSSLARYAASPRNPSA